MFASAFLLPREPMMDLIAPDFTLESYARLKAKWGVSIQALVRRARDVGIIDYNRYRSLMIQISSRGWRKNEPVHIPVEMPLTRTPSLPTLGHAETAEAELATTAPQHTPSQMASVTNRFEKN